MNVRFKQLDPILGDKADTETIALSDQGLTQDLDCSEAETGQPSIQDNLTGIDPAENLDNSPNSILASDRLPNFLIGLLLMSTAIAKLWMLLTDSFADLRVGIPKEILWLSVAFEFWLAYENFRVRDQRVMAFINSVVFASFGIFATIRLSLGYTSCGCSGSLELPGWLFLGIDIAIVAWFSSTCTQRCLTRAGVQFVRERLSSIVWPTAVDLDSNRKINSSLAGRASGLAFAILIIIALPWLKETSIAARILGSDPLPSVRFYAGDLSVNAESEIKIPWLNKSSRTINFVGSRTSCTCLGLSQPRFTCDSASQIELPVLVRPRKSGIFHQRIVCFVDHPEQDRLILDIVANAVDPQKELGNVQ